MENKPLIFCNASVPVRNGENVTTIETWELIPIGPSPLLHAVWDRNDQKLAVQFDSVKESVVPYIKQGSSKAKPTQELAERKEEKYYITRIADVAAIQAIMDNFVANYDGQEWKLDPLPVEQLEGPVEVESKQL